MFLEVSKMKMIRRFSGLALAVSTVLAFGIPAVTAQTTCDADAIAESIAKITANYKLNATVAVAIEEARNYLQKYSQCEGSEQMVSWIKVNMPDMEKRDAIHKEFVWKTERIAKFDGGIKNGKFDDVFQAGAELVQKYPDNMQFLLPLGLIGLSESYRNNFKYNDDSIKFAKIALAKFKSGTPEPKIGKDGQPLLDGDKQPVFGSFQFERNAVNAISELNYALGYMLYYGKKDKKAGLLYFYEVSQSPGSLKNEPRLYATIGQYYLEESAPIGTAIADLIKRQDAASTDEEKAKLDLEIKPKEALYNGYLERALDALSRAYRVTDDKVASEKTLKEQIYKMLQATHGKRDPAVALDKWIADASLRPLADPASDVSPVFDPEPSTVTTAKPALPEAKPAPAKTKPPAAKKPSR